MTTKICTFLAQYTVVAEIFAIYAIDEEHLTEDISSVCCFKQATNMCPAVRRAENYETE
jgi:hypothetical protein